jgi:F0F1-type ATP synthase membrane subunit b/b'
MSDNTDDPFSALLRERERELTGVIDDATARREEVRTLLATVSDGRTRVRRRLRTEPAPGNGAGEQPAAEA